ncbi:MAG: hypothetical protein IJ598_01195 [Ruminococcus sp.]|nr:hypothetical protein [Ruminococcus sp.]
MASILSNAMIVNAQSSVSTYVTTAQELYSELQTVINNLTAAGFMGDASNGYREFFTTKATPALVNNLTEPQGSLTAGINSMLTTIKEQLLDTVDPGLGKLNQNPGQA